MRSRLLATMIAAAAGLVAAPAAHAEVRAGAGQDPIDSQTTGTLDPPPPVIEVTGSRVTYNRDAGAVTVAVTFNGPATRAAYVALVGRQTCRDSNTTNDSQPRLSVELNTPAPDQTDDDNLAEASLQGLVGSAVGPETVSADGLTVSATVTHPQFVNRDWTCVSGGSYAANGRLDTFAFTFSGFEPQKLTTATATAALFAELARRYGPAWRTPGAWTACPEQEFFPEGISEDATGAQTLCEFRVRVGSRWRHGQVLLGENLGDIEAQQFSSRTFLKALRTCKPLRTLRADRVSNRRLRAGGFVGCNDNSASLIRDLHRLKPGSRTVSFHGTNRAGFGDAVRFRCKLRARSGARRTASCVNRLDDRFIYSFRLRSR